MRWSRTVTMIEAHAEGEVGRVITGGVLDVPGATMLDKLAHINEVDDSGNSARLAVRHARGGAQPGETLTARSIIGSMFEVGFAGETEVGDRPAVLPRISGRGWIHGIHQIGVDPDDPWPQGYKVADCRGDAFDLMN